VAQELARMGAHVIVHGRDEERGREVVDRIAADGRGSARFYRADFASFQEVHELADAILADYDRLDVLVHNAGLGRGPPGQEREVSRDGLELRFQVNYLATVLLTHRLLPLLEGSAPSRIVNVASAGQAPIDFDDVMLEREYEGGRAYAQSKLAQILYTFDLAAELEDAGITVNALHPASGMPTNMLRVAERPVRSTVEEGVEAVLNLVTNPEVGTGHYFSGLEVARPNEQAFDLEARARLRALSRRLTGIAPTD
jgi:NAD(P)-dependent dehydrogenase (short-subunit alcohol dehydrogenase family)